MKRRLDERGQAGGVEAIAFGLLVFVVGTLIVANAWGVVDAKWAAAAAAREGARTYAEVGSDAGDADGPARLASAAALESLGRHGSVEVRLDDDTYRRCGRVELVVTTSVPVLHLPFVHAHGGSYTVTGTASAVVDPYRSGIPGEVSC